MASGERVDPGFDLELDVLIAGSGLGSLTAAIVAHDLGKRVAVFEKAPRMGGLCGYGGGEVFCPNGPHMAEIGERDSDDAARRYVDFLAAGYNDPALTDVLMARYREAIAYLEKEAGLRWIPIKGLPDYYYPDAPGSATGRYLSVALFDGKSLGPWQQRTWSATPHIPPGVLHEEIYAWGGLASVTRWDYALIAKRIEQDLRSAGPGMMGYVCKAAFVDRGIAGHVEAPLVRLIADGAGRVVGGVVQQQGRELRVRAQGGVLLGVGGYDHAPALAAMYENMPEWHSAAPPYFHGDALTLGGEVGAAVACVPPTNLGMFFGYHIPGEEHGGVPLYRSSWECGVPHALWVNRRGERFCDESFYKDSQVRARAWNGRTQSQDNLPPFLIFDSNYREKYPLGSFMPGSQIPAELAVQADTPRELAQELGIDPDGLERTLREFNAHAARGEDPAFGTGHYPWAQRLVGDLSYPNPNLGVVEKPPFYGVRLVPVGVGINSHGLRTDAHGRVVHVRGHAIPGLYAVGISAALLDLGAGYQSGTSNMRAITWGYVAGHHVAGKPL
jgi:3-oxosteroid 1-dehydrogenase